MTRSEGWQNKAFDDIYGNRMGNRPGTRDGEIARAIHVARCVIIATKEQ